MKQVKILLLLLAIAIHEHYCFFVRIVNMTTCNESDLEEGELEANIQNRYRFDQQITGKLTLPVDLDDDAILQYKASVLNDDREWDVIYQGDRHVCGSVVRSLPYQKLAEETSFPSDCPISEGTYWLTDYPISGDYVVLNTVRGLDPIVKHRIRLLQDGLLILSIEDEVYATRAEGECRNHPR